MQDAGSKAGAEDTWISEFGLWTIGLPRTPPILESKIARQPGCSNTLHYIPLSFHVGL